VQSRLQSGRIARDAERAGQSLPVPVGTTASVTSRVSATPARMMRAPPRSRSRRRRRHDAAAALPQAFRASSSPWPGRSVWIDS